MINSDTNYQQHTPERNACSPAMTKEAWESLYFIIDVVYTCPLIAVNKPVCLPMWTWRCSLCLYRYYRAGRRHDVVCCAFPLHVEAFPKFFVALEVGPYDMYVYLCVEYHKSFFFCNLRFQTFVKAIYTRSYEIYKHSYHICILKWWTLSAWLSNYNVFCSLNFHWLRYRSIHGKCVFSTYTNRLYISTPYDHVKNVHCGNYYRNVQSCCAWYAFVYVLDKDSETLLSFITKIEICRFLDGSPWHFFGNTESSKCYNKAFSIIFCVRVAFIFNFQSM